MGRTLSHRTATNRFYRDRTVHAAEGVHQFAAKLCSDHLPSGSRILELGAGTGALALRLKDLGFAVTPTDLEPSSEDVVAFDVSEVNDTSIDFASFQLILGVELIEHLENPRGFMKAIFNRLRSGQLVLLSTPHVAHPHSRLKFFLRGEPFIFGPEHYYGTGHISILPDWLLTEHLRYVGYEVCGVWHAGELDKSPCLRRVAHACERWLLSAIGLRMKAAQGDGVSTFVLARKP